MMREITFKLDIAHLFTKSPFCGQNYWLAWDVMNSLLADCWQESVRESGSKLAVHRLSATDGKRGEMSQESWASTLSEGTLFKGASEMQNIKRPPWYNLLPNGQTFVVV